MTESAATPYDAALALQTWFRETFEYQLDTPSGHGADALGEFLSRRAGYSEQFAGAFAVMARTVGIPSRVAVGFTSGTVDEVGWYEVFGTDAHAWPELWFDGLGWVPFEPTPGRSNPTAAAWTGIEP